MSGTNVIHHAGETTSPVAGNGVAPPAPATQPTPTAASSIADPAALGLAAFAMTTFVLSVVNAGLIQSAATPVVLGLALFYGGIAQLFAGMWEFRRGNVFGAVAFSSYGAFWLSFFFYVDFVAGGLAKVGEANAATGLFLLAWAIFTGYMMIAAFRTNMAVLLVFVFLFLTYVALVIGAWGGIEVVNKVGGWLGIVTAVIAWYTSFAIVLNSTFKKTLLPLGPLE
ncbi:acetate uptake transporter [Intrasporangium sp.]|uniref:acetate uptake transporter n=1 Tax=Intrasporangium sp. TaxID=1925024 RepID=UPI003221554B